MESPNKIKKITDLLDKLKKIPNFEKCSFLVTASMGHIREIDKTRVGIDINNKNHMIQIGNLILKKEARNIGRYSDNRLQYWSSQKLV